MTDDKWPPSAVGAGIAQYIDHTLLKPEAAAADIERLCEEAAEYRFVAVCVNGCWVESCSRHLAGTEVKIATVVGFPLGATLTQAKAHEASNLVDRGADELDMVAPLGHIFANDWGYVAADIAAVVDAAAGRTVKVILETAALDSDRIVEAATVAMKAGAHFVKTSTGFHPAGGATVDAVRLLRVAVRERLGVKAAGGIRDRETAIELIGAGANRIGTSSGVALVRSHSS
jgi:deoxyribose-phosphate aldolase